MIRKALIFSILFLSIIGILRSQQNLSIERDTSDIILAKTMTPVQASVIKPFLFGHEAFYADLFYIHSVRWSVERSITNMFEYLYKMMDLVTDLDPRFEQAYIWASFALADASSLEKTNKEKIQASNKILSKGLDYSRQDVLGWNHIPNAWMIPSGLAYNYGIELKDKKKALEYAQILKNIPDLPPFMKTWAAGLYRESDEKQKGKDFLEDLLAVETIQARIKMVDDENVKEQLKGKLLAFYKKMDSDEYGYHRMMQIQERARVLVEKWRDDYAFLPFPLFVILNSNETDMEERKKNDFYNLFFPYLGGDKI